MIDDKLIQKYLKRSNVSVDTDKTKSRVNELWKRAEKEQKEKILSSSNLSVQAVYRTRKTGTISATLIVPFAQVIDICPSYITGETDESCPCTADSMAAFLKQQGYDSLLAAQQRLDRKKEKEEEPDEMPEDVSPTAEETDISFAESMTEDEATQLLSALFLKAKAGGKNLERLNQIREMLLI